ncbi:transmembrane protein 17B-like [Apteryx mantelli]|uniref:Transmembrane protein 17B-like n=1 Tax=Apteryx mantelli TaxID=2696672 RepID=A0ABM4FDY9_9AVES
MAVHTPLPRNIRWGLTTLSGSLFINNKTRDSGSAQIYHPVTLSLAALLQYSLLPRYYQLLLVAAFLILSLAEGFRLYLGYIGNLQEKVPELAGFLLLSFLIQLPLLLFLLTDNNIIRLPLETAVHILYLAFLASEIPVAFFALRAMTKQLAMQFYLQQFKDGDRPRREGRKEQEARRSRTDDALGTVLL